MSLWGSKDQANNAPKNAILAGNGVSANGNTLFGNTQVSAYIGGVGAGVFGVDATEAGNTTGDGKKVAHAGWNTRKIGTGGILSISIVSPGSNYRSNGFITFSNGGGANANASFSVNTISNTIQTITIVNPGVGYTSAPTANAANSTSVNSAVLAVTMGGRTGRVQCETLVAMGSMTSDAENTIFPN